MREVDPKDTSRAQSYQLFIHAPMPMVTIFRTFDVTRLVRLSKKGYPFTMLMCYCAAAAASQVEEFFLLPVGDKLMQYDHIGVNTIVANQCGGINSCDLPFYPDLEEFHQSYRRLTAQVRETCRDYEIADRMIVGTSNLAKYSIDGVINFYSGIFNNPFLIWGRYERNGFRKRLKLSFQFHHVQMDGEQACRFLDHMQETMNRL
ncbi:MAG: CatA-like O-acetyltransferase, family 2 [Butyricicoccus sp.]